MAEKEKKRVPLAEEFSQKVIEHLKAGTAPWQKPWKGKPDSMPHNPIATGASINQATKLPVVVAFDAGNLVTVAEKFRERFPNAAITICADNDHRAKENIGIKRAQEAAEKVGGKVIIPTLNKKEVEQGLTDFNDLHQSRGLKEVAKQISSGLQRKQGKGMER